MPRNLTSVSFSVIKSAREIGVLNRAFMNVYSGVACSVLKLQCNLKFNYAHFILHVRDGC